MCKLEVIRGSGTLLKATKLLVFFGAPHQGIRNAGQLEDMIDSIDEEMHELKGRMKEIVQRLREDSTWINEHRECLTGILNSPRILSIQEKLPTGTLHKVNHHDAV